MPGGMSVGNPVYFTAFLKRDKNKFYMCKGHIVELLQKGDRKSLKVQIDAVALHSVGGAEEYTQASLLGRTITKKYREVNRQPPEFMKPSGWIVVLRGQLLV